jgi:putative DNA primase/helicase
VRDLDADPYLLNVANGTLDLRTMELPPHDPADRITKSCRGAYREVVESPVWEGFLRYVLPDEDVLGYLHRTAGVGLLGEIREHVLPILTATGANGKTTFDKALRFALGDYAIAAEPDLFTHRDGAHPTGQMDLRGVRWASVSETNTGSRLAEATMKRLTGGDTIRARRMRQDFVEFKPSHTAVFIVNSLPRASGDDEAVWRRLRVVPFNVVIPEPEWDRELDGKLELEADAILSWAVAGWKHYAVRGLDAPDAVRAATDKYRLDNDAVGRFIAESCATGPTIKGDTTTVLHREYLNWAEQDGSPPIGLHDFGAALDRRGHSIGRAGSRRVRKGIALRDGMTDYESIRDRNLP